jgi:chorismate lyase / 3-hydroxybenzoate synthase
VTSAWNQALPPPDFGNARYLKMLRLTIQSGLDMPAHSNVLGVIQYGGSTEATLTLKQVPRQYVRASTPSGQATYFIFSSDAPVNYGTMDDCRYAHDGRVLYATISCPDAATEATCHDARALEKIIFGVYCRAFALMQRLGFRHLWRTWNYLSDINVETGGMERYRQFNVGRHEAFAENLSIAHGTMPAACALGTATQGLSVAILASNSGFEQIENPRQNSAYEYPRQYGPRSPTFSRAILARMQDSNYLFISGTASIVGHASVHVGDVAAQTLEAVNNIKTILAEANSRQAGKPTNTHYALQNLNCVVYVRYVQDFAAVESILAAQIKSAANTIVYLQADICRKELLVEIEAFCFDH